MNRVIRGVWVLKATKRRVVDAAGGRNDNAAVELVLGMIGGRRRCVLSFQSEVEQSRVK